MRNPSAQGALQEEASRAGVTVEVLELDVTIPSTIDAAVTELKRRTGAIDLLVNNAGIGIVGAIEETSDEEMRAIFDTNFFGLASVTRAVVAGMRERRRGRIINVTSAGGRIGTPATGVYAASKFAVEGLSEALSLELAPFGVDVALVEPGAFRTEMTGPKVRRTAQANAPSSPYQKICVSIERQFERIYQSGPDPRQVADAVVEAATAERPKFRYPVGKDAMIGISLKALLPDRAFQRVFMNLFERTLGR